MIWVQIGASQIGFYPRKGCVSTKGPHTQVKLNLRYLLLLWQNSALNLEFKYRLKIYVVIIIQDTLASIVINLLLVILVLIGVAFLTLLERKVLGYIQIRKGPNKVGWAGIPQPIADAVKLFTKESTLPTISNLMIYMAAPIASIFLALITWRAIPCTSGMHSFKYRILFFLCCTRLGVYAVLFCGWSSNSKYSVIGGLRSVAQTISYEVSLALILISFLLLTSEFTISGFSEIQNFGWLSLLAPPLALMWFASSLAETNRTPFDFAEGESELVSGFNIEYSSGGFALIFIAEYASILFISALIGILFLGPTITSYAFAIKTSIIASAFLWVRGTLPRFRYDKLISLAWKSFLPTALNYLLIFIGVKLLIEFIYHIK